MTGPLLNAHALAEMRLLQEANMPSTCELIGVASSRLAGGSPKLTPVVLATVKCRLINVGAALPTRAAQLTPTASYLIVVPADTDTVAATRARVSGTTDDVAWIAELELAGLEEPRSYSASRRILANLAPPLTTTTAVASVEVYEA